MSETTSRATHHAQPLSVPAAQPLTLPLPPTITVGITDKDAAAITKIQLQFARDAAALASKAYENMLVVHSGAKTNGEHTGTGG